MRPIRSLLFAPANRSDLLQKFLRYPADAFAIDLEDATPEEEKAAARGDLPRNIRYLREQGLKAQLFVRTNEPRSRHLEEDLRVALDASVDGVMIPKLETPADLHLFASAPQVIGIIETARGVVNVETIVAGAGRSLAALAFGAEDFCTDVGGLRTSAGLEVLYARSRVILAARAAGLQALDQVFVNIRDDVAFRQDAEMGRQLGYSGKMCVVPRQIEIANQVFSPSVEEVEWSRRLIDAYEKAQGEGRGSFEFDGRMVDEPLLKRARAIVRLAGEIRLLE
jgi:citrate lyase subunit beta / citryl-CoA lyase